MRAAYILAGDLPSVKINDITNHGTALIQMNLICNALKDFVHKSVEHMYDQKHSTCNGTFRRYIDGIAIVLLSVTDSDFGTNYNTHWIVHEKGMCMHDRRYPRKHIMMLVIAQLIPGEHRHSYRWTSILE